MTSLNALFRQAAGRLTAEQRAALDERLKARGSDLHTAETSDAGPGVDSLLREVAGRRARATTVPDPSRRLRQDFGGPLT
jgi:uncharacterized protein YbaP (TraB family)